MSRATTPPIPAVAFADEARKVGPQVIDGMGGPGDIVELFAEEGAGKTRTAWSLMLAVMGNERAWGPFRILQHGSVLYVPPDPPEATTGRLIDEVRASGHLLDRLVLPRNGCMPHFRVGRDQRVVAENPCEAPSDCVLVVLDTWTSLISVESSAADIFQEPVARAVARALRAQYPTQMLVALNHTTRLEGGGFSGMSPGLARLAETRYRLIPSRQHNAIGQWTGNGALSLAKTRSIKLLKTVTLNWREGAPLPMPTLDGIEVAQLVDMWPHLTGVTPDHQSVRSALQELADLTGQAFESLKKEQQRHPNPVLAVIKSGAPERGQNGKFGPK